MKRFYITERIFLFASQAPFLFSRFFPRFQFCRTKWAVAWRHGEVGVFLVPKVKNRKPPQNMSFDADVIGPGHPLYPMLKDAMESKEMVIYEMNPETKKLEKKA